MIHMFRTRRPPIHTSVVCVHMPPALRAVVEKYADENHFSIGEAGRSLLEAGAKALGIAEVS
jgi:predicted phosphoribosyltransferase